MPGKALGGHVARQDEGRPQVDVQVSVPGVPLDLTEAVVPEEGGAVHQQGDGAHAGDHAADERGDGSLVAQVTGKHAGLAPRRTHLFCGRQGV